jgi:hypothetical protein
MSTISSTLLAALASLQFMSDKDGLNVRMLNLNVFKRSIELYPLRNVYDFQSIYKKIPYNIAGLPLPRRLLLKWSEQSQEIVSYLSARDKTDQNKWFRHVTHFLTQSCDAYSCSFGQIEMPVFPYRPICLEHITFCNIFALPMSAFALSQSLTSITMSDTFNSSIEMLKGLNSLTFLDLGKEFTRTFSHDEFPPNLNHLKLCVSDFKCTRRQTFKDCTFPNSLRILEWCHSQDIILPELLHTAIITANENDRIDQICWPKSVEKMIVKGKYNNSYIPIGTWKQLCLSQCPFYSQPLGFLVSLNNLNTFTIHSNYSCSINKTVIFPPNIDTLSLWDDANLSNIELPINIRNLSLGNESDNQLPTLVSFTNLHILHLGQSFTRSLFGYVFPINLTTLIFGDAWNKSLDGILFPMFLKHIKFGCSFNKPIDKVVWPSELSTLEMGGEFNHPLSGIDFPSTITRFTCGFSFNQDVSTCNFKEGVLCLYKKR